MEKAGTVEQIEVVIPPVHQLFGKGDQEAIDGIVELELVQLSGNDAIQHILAHPVFFQIDVEASIPIPDPDDLDMLMPVGHQVLFALICAKPL
jgi:hypothetical protein